MAVAKVNKEAARVNREAVAKKVADSKTERCLLRKIYRFNAKIPYHITMEGDF